MGDDVLPLALKEAVKWFCMGLKMGATDLKQGSVNLTPTGRFSLDIQLSEYSGHPLFTFKTRGSFDESGNIEAGITEAEMSAILRLLRTHADVQMSWGGAPYTELTVRISHP